MKSVASKIFLNVLKMIGLKRAMKLGWKFIYPKLLEYAKKSPQDWDDRTLKFINDNIYKIIDSL